ncbi:MAG: alpha/beta hydrolase [Calditrichia bacterium]
MNANHMLRVFSITFAAPCPSAPLRERAIAFPEPFGYAQDKLNRGERFHFSEGNPGHAFQLLIRIINRLLLLIVLSSSLFAQSLEPELLPDLRSDFLQQTEFTSTTTAHINSYLQYYSLPDSVDYRYRSISADTFQLAVQIFSPPDPTGSMLIVHGYNAHAGLQQQLIRHLLDMKMRVILYDQPGHGLSTGKTASIAEFDVYGEALQSVINATSDYLTEPQLMMGHSMGCAVILTWLQENPQTAFEDYIFLAPLVKHRFWQLGKLGTKVISPMRNSIPRRFKASSSDTAFVSFWRKDPLMGRKVPLEWVQALYRWYESVKSVQQFPGKLLVVQGDKDRVVDWRFNLPFLAERFSGERLYLLEGAMHQLQNEGLPLRKRVLQQIGFWVQDKQEELVEVLE